MRKLFILLIIIPFIALAGCNLTGDGGLFSGNLTMKLTDDPINLDGKTVESINVTITKVEVSKGTEEEDDAEWITVIDEKQKYDLMKLQDGNWDFLAEDVSLEAGQYNQIRIHVTRENTITFENDSTEYDLKIPSAAESGVKLTGANFIVEAGQETEVVVDFDAEESVHVTGEGRYIMRPTIRMVENPDLEEEPVENES